MFPSKATELTFSRAGPLFQPRSNLLAVGHQLTRLQRKTHHGVDRVSRFNEFPPMTRRQAIGIPRGKKTSLRASAARSAARTVVWLESRRGRIRIYNSQNLNQSVFHEHLKQGRPSATGSDYQYRVPLNFSCFNVHYVMWTGRQALFLTKVRHTNTFVKIRNILSCIHTQLSFLAASVLISIYP